MGFEPLTLDEEQAATAIVDSAYTVHSKLGPGLLESVYEVCLCHELLKRSVQVERQVIVPIEYDGLKFDEGFRIDVLANQLVVCELKAVNKLNPVFEAQLLTYLKLTGKRLGFLINFNVSRIKDGIRRFVL